MKSLEHVHGDVDVRTATVHCFEFRTDRWRASINVAAVVISIRRRWRRTTTGHSNFRDQSVHQVNSDLQKFKPCAPIREVRQVFSLGFILETIRPMVRRQMSHVFRAPVPWPVYKSGQHSQLVLTNCRCTSRKSIANLNFATSVQMTAFTPNLVSNISLCYVWTDG